ncbi:MAG: phospholipid carrier-dependent glycosyltransferase [Candidatus Aureabacteria bacterium]|nr:phospholipid carrier-dependent glycosyltransferase [Candidatus Auribacterota bacterium]
MNKHSSANGKTSRRSSHSIMLHIVVLLTILAAAAALRITGSPLYHPDEHLVVVQASYMPQQKFKPGTFNYPSFYPTFLALIYKYFPSMGKGIVGKLIYPADTVAITTFYQLQARFTTAMLGTLTVLCVYLIGLILGWPLAGLAGAAFLAVSLNNVENSHFATVDAPMAFNATLAFLFSCMHYRSRRLVWALLGGLWCGLTIGTKYNGVLITAPFFLSLVLVAIQKRSLKAWLTVLAGILSVPCGFLLACPYFLSMKKTYLDELRVQMNIYRQGFAPWDNSLGPNNWIWNITYFFRAGMGMLPMVLCISGLAALIFSAGIRGWLVVCFPLCYYAFISHQSVRITRNLTVLTPFISLMAGYALWRLCARIRERYPAKRELTAVVLAAIIIAVFWQPTLLSFRYAKMMKQTDPRTKTIEWAKSNIPKRGKVAIDFLFGPFLSKETYKVTSDMELGRYPLSWYLDNGYDFIITSSGYTVHWAPGFRPDFTRFYAELRDRFQEVAVFPGNELGLHQSYYAVPTRPTIAVYDLHKPRYSAVTILAPAADSSVDRSACELRWSFQDAASHNLAQAYQVEVTRHRDDVTDIEAETLLDKASSRNGWASQNHIHSYRGDGFISAGRNNPPLVSTFSLERAAGAYQCWVRYNPQRDGATELIVASSTLPIKSEGREQWEWQRVGSVELSQGENKISITHSGKGDTVIDVIVFSTNPAFDPRKDSVWAPAITTGEVHSPETFLPASRFSALEPGLCRARVKASNQRGQWGTWSSPVMFNLLKGSN